jgi:hypothetical protein
MQTQSDVYDDRRELRAWRLGRLADRCFLAECHRRQLDPYFAVLAPLDAITGTDTVDAKVLRQAIADVEAGRVVERDDF